MACHEMSYFIASGHVFTFRLYLFLLWELKLLLDIAAGAAATGARIPPTGL